MTPVLSTSVRNYVATAIMYFNEIFAFTAIPVIDITETEKVYNITEGDSSITCTATGYPVPDIVWLNNDGSAVDGNRIKPDSAIATGIGNLYNVSVSMTVGRNDTGVYICIANNSVGNDTRTINICKELCSNCYNVF